MTTQAAQAEIIFRRDGVNKKVNKVKGEAPAANEALLKAELLRKEINPLKAKKKSKP
jgi:type II secretory pathway component PulF